MLDLLSDNCGITETDSSEAITEKVRGSLQEVGLDPDEGAPYLLHLLGQPAGTDTRFTYTLTISAESFVDKLMKPVLVRMFRSQTRK
ncbi:MAG: hypothetical protein HC853_17155, partial [Anaerolineae bacterium]|nr:hypothetical protein [Anaerolineae bacterium]